MTANLSTLPVAQLETCDRVRVRKVQPKPDGELVQEYTEAYEAGLLLEPLDVFRETDTERYIVADGEHRLLAARRAKIATVPVRLREGDEVDALEFAMRRNQAHGLRLTKADRYHQFSRLMETPRLRNKYRTDSELAEQIGVTIRTIQNYRSQWRQSEGGDSRTRARKDRACERAERHDPSRNMKISCSETRVVEPKTPPPTRKTMEPQGTQPQPKPKPLTPKQREVAQQIRQSDRPYVSHAERQDFTRMLALSRSLPAPTKLAQSGIKIDWERVEQAHRWLGALLEARDA